MKRILRDGEYQRSDGRYRYRYIMGHSDISVTLNVYTHVQFDDAQAEMIRLAQA